MNQSNDNNQDSQKPALRNANNWPIAFDQARNPPLWLSNAITALICLAAILLFCLSIVALWHLTLDLLGADQQRASEAVKSFLPIAAAAIGLPLIIWRLAILNRQTTTAETKTQIDRETHYTSIFSRSVDQLGQTREIKETRVVEGVTETGSKTVPNIEVRLGGIHSLTRLADESVRDASKIEKMLISYIRENSWSTRYGEEASRPIISRIRHGKFLEKYQSEKLPDDAIASYEEWSKKVDSANQVHIRWGAKLADARVDVNEALEAVAEIKTGSDKNVSSLFYECLFVGRLLKKQLLEKMRFERCAFVRCQFKIEDAPNLTFEKSLFLNCNFEINGSRVKISNSAAIDSTFDLKKSQITFRFTDLVSAGFGGLESSEVSFSFCTNYRGWYGTANEITIKSNYTTFVAVNFSQNIFSSRSEFDECDLIDIDGTAADFSNATFEEALLDHVKADPSTKHPLKMKRPDSWPAYDEKFESEIPF